jgi:dihydroflavonol-4-reductase
VGIDNELDTDVDISLILACCGRALPVLIAGHSARTGAGKEDEKVRALVTGGTGFIGSHLVEHLLSRGYEVSCLVRTTSNIEWIRGLPVRFIYGDCERKETLMEAVRGQDYIFHLAGRLKSLDWDSYYRTNCVGTRNIAEACVEFNPRVRRFVYVSSIAAAGPSERGRLKSEEDECAPVNDYGRTKLLGEEEVRSLRGKLPFVIVRPPNVLGSRQEELCAIFGIIRRRVKPLLGNGDNQLSIVFVQDLVRGIEMAATHGDTEGNTYFITDGKTYSWRRIADVVADKLGVSGFCIPIPHALLVLLASLTGAVARCKGEASFFNGKLVNHLRETYQTYDGSKAERDFGFRPSLDLEAGIGLAAEWYAARGCPSPVRARGARGRGRLSSRARKRASRPSSSGRLRGAARRTGSGASK